MEDVKLAVARPGDVLVVGLSVSVSDDEYTLLVERFQPLMDMGIQVFLVEHCSSLVVVKGER